MHPKIRKFFNSYWVSSSSYGILNNLVNSISGILSFMILVRSYSKGEFGTWILYQTVVGIIEPIRNGFINTPLVTIYHNEKDELTKESICSNSFRLNLIFGIVSGLTLLIFGHVLASFWKADGLTNLFQIFAIASVVYTFLSHTVFVQQLNFSFKGSFYSTLSRKILFVTLIAIMFFTSTTLPLTYIAVFDLVSIILAAFVSWGFSRRFNFGSRRFDLGIIKRLAAFGKFTIATNLGSIIFKNIDSWMLGKLISTTAVSLYNPAIRISNLSEIPNLAISRASYPKFATKYKEQGKPGIKNIYEKTVALSTAINAPIILFLILFSKYFILLLAGKEYLETTSIVQVTLFIGLIVPFVRQFGVLTNAIGRPQLNLVTMLCAIILNLICNFFFIQRFGVIGAAYGTLLSYAALMIFCQIYLYRRLKINFAYILLHSFLFYNQILSSTKKFLKYSIK